MNVAIIGTGNFAKALAAPLSRTRNGVVFGARNSEAGHAAAESFVQTNGRAVQGGSIEDAIAVSEAVVLAVPFIAIDEVLRTAGDLAGKTVIDPTNPLTDGFSLALGFETSAAERIQHKIPKAGVVKAFNTIFSNLLHDRQSNPGRVIQTFLASDNAAAKAVVSRLAGDIGLEALDVGELSNARYLEPLGALNVRLGLRLGRGTSIAPTWTGLNAA